MAKPTLVPKGTLTTTALSKAAAKAEKKVDKPKFVPKPHLEHRPFRDLGKMIAAKAS